MLWFLVGIGMVLVVEGLVLALAPSRIEDMLDMLRQIPVDSRRVIGLLALALGVIMIWVAKVWFG